jgi:hypothetical protein
VAERAVASLLVAVLALTGCADGGDGTSMPDDPLQVTDKLVAATPARSPATTTEPAGTVRPGEPLQQAHRTARLGEWTLIARGRDGIEVRRGGKRVKMITDDLASADQVFVADGHAAVLDRLRSALFQVDVEAGEVRLGLRAGQGATNGTVDEFGRVLVVDTRRGALLAFSLEPLLLRQRYPVPGSPYGIAYDARRNVAWVTVTETNEVVGFDVAGGEPQERYRFPTVRQPNSVTVDAHTGDVLVASGAGEGNQVIRP